MLSSGVTPPALTEDEAMSGPEYRNADAGYLEWLAAHADGYVINIERSHRATNARLHRARCTWIRARRSGGFLTDQYLKICGESLADKAGASRRALPGRMTVCWSLSGSPQR